MKKNIRINYIFWKEGPLLPRLLSYEYKSSESLEYEI
jgi:hypothetical protein